MATFCRELKRLFFPPERFLCNDYETAVEVGHIRLNHGKRAFEVRPEADGRWVVEVK